MPREKQFWKRIDIIKYNNQTGYTVDIDVFLDNDYTKEEMKMVNETQKILHKKIEVSATCVRVPVLRSHSEAITIHFEREVDAAAARE